MIPGIIAAAAWQQLNNQGGGGGSSIAVSFNSARLVLPSISCIDNAYFSFAGWFNADWDYSGATNTVFWVDPAGTYSSHFQGNSDASATFSAGTSETGAIVAAPPLISGSWQHILATVQTSPSRIIKIYLDDADASASLSIFGPTFTPILSNGLPLWIGSSYPGANFFQGDICDLSIWPGISFLTDGDIAEATRRLFIGSSGERIESSVAIATLGSPAVMLSGNVSTFALNDLGTSGALTLAEGTLSNAATNPP